MTTRIFDGMVQIRRPHQQLTGPVEYYSVVIAAFLPLRKRRTTSYHSMTNEHGGLVTYIYTAKTWAAYMAGAAAVHRTWGD